MREINHLRRIIREQAVSTDGFSGFKLNFADRSKNTVIWKPSHQQPKKARPKVWAGHEREGEHVLQDL
jgi:hypothetical protein